MSDAGWAKSYRRKWTHHVFRNFRDAAIWGYLTDNAAWRDGSMVRFEGRQIELKRGQLAVSERFLADGFCCDRQVIRRTLAKLEGEQMLTRDKTQGISLITICNYENYQGSGEDEKPVVSPQKTQAEPTFVPKIEESKKVNKEESLLASQATLSAAKVAWDVMAKSVGLPKISRLTEPRKNGLIARLKDLGGMSGWRIAMLKISENDFFHGKNDRGWRADIDFFLRPKVMTKLMEGGYDRARITAKPTHDDKSRAAHDALDAVFARPVGAGSPSGMDDPRSVAGGPVIDDSDARDLLRRGQAEAGHR